VALVNATDHWESDIMVADGFRWWFAPFHQIRVANLSSAAGFGQQWRS
jgi:hypothetical protein